MKYFLYARKSSESEDRQIQSIDDQISRLKQLANDLNLNIKKIYVEAKSAKKPDNRPVFNEMMQRIENNDAEGILCWQINRLSRNPIDSGKISWLLQKSVLKSIQTIDRNYLPEDNVLLFNVESGMANQFILDLSKNVKRGMRSKIEKGWYPHIPPIGYLNDKAEKTIVEDPERFAIVRRIWDKMLTGAYTPPQILKIANSKWGLRTRRFKKLGNKELGTSGIYKMLTNVFYTGSFKHKGIQYQGKHKQMITMEEFDQVQTFLGRKGRPRSKKHSFAYTGIIRCGECGCAITAEKKVKRIKSTGKLKTYKFYHCTRRKKNVVCSQRKFIPEEQLEKMLVGEIEKYTILPEFRDWALKILRENNDVEINDRKAAYKSQSIALESNQKEVDNLTQMRFRELISEDEYKKHKEVLLNQQSELRKARNQIENRADKWLKLTEKTFDFAVYARHHFINGDINTKKEILMALGQNFQLKDEILTLEAHSWLQPIAKSYPSLERKYLKLEPAKRSPGKELSSDLEPILTSWQG